MTQAPSNIGPYTIDREIGRGGMGVVYLARDPRLDRDVAIKALPADLAADPDRLARFDREAKTLASLNHPNLAGIHGVEEVDGALYLILEYVPGVTLAERLDQGPLAADDAIEICLQLADGLEAAHNAGVIHRDLKPANIKLTPEGQLKILDFGLAKAIATDTSTSNTFGDSPTLTTPALGHSPTMPGAILGTAAYMSPEQARGRHIDKRADVWAWGVILYECLTGASPFRGETVSDSIGAILRDDVDFDQLPADAPPSVTHVLNRCLARDRNERYRDIGDAAMDLKSDDAALAPGAAHAGSSTRTGPIAFAFLCGAILIAGAMFAFGAFRSEPAPKPPPMKRFALSGFSMPYDAFLSVALSPDGRYLALRLQDDTSIKHIYVRPLDSLEMTRIEQSGNAWLPFFSPDGEKVGFFSSGQIRVATIASGATHTLCEVEGGFSGAAWLRSGDIIFAGRDARSLYRVPATGGTPVEIPLKGSSEVGLITSPAPLPRNDVVLCSVGRNGRFDLGIFSLEDGAIDVIAESGFTPIYVSSGHVLYQQGQSGPLMALPFDAQKIKATGRPFTVIDDIGSRNSFQTQGFAASNDGTIVHFPPTLTQDEGTLVIVDRDGAAKVIAEIDRLIVDPRLSNDEKRIAIRAPAPNCDYWIYDRSRKTSSRITHEGDNHGADWTADDNEVYMVRRHFNTGAVVRSRADGVMDDQIIGEHSSAFVWLLQTLPDEKHLLISTRHDETGADIEMLNIETGALTPILNGRFDENGAVVSPDQSVIAYVSSETGRSEVYIQPFPELSSRFQVSVNGGTEPLWSRDGSTLYFRMGDAMLEAKVATSPELRAETPVTIFEGAYAVGPVQIAGYDVTADGEGFIMVHQRGNDVTAANLEIILNWTSELDRLDPSRRR